LKASIYNSISQHKQAGKKQLAVLIDPDSIQSESALIHICKLAEVAHAGFILIGGSLITNGYFESCVRLIKQHCKIPVLLFPGNILQISDDADAILLLSLISGRNADLLIGKHVLAAPQLKASQIQIIPTGYMLIDGGRTTSVSYMSNTIPIPADKPAIAATTAMAGEMLGLQTIYMDAGSGAIHPIPNSIIKAVRQHVNVPIFVGGGIRTPEQAANACHAGADVVVVGNAFEDNPELMKEIAAAINCVSVNL
jgi:phosphoglycerol geranylgeranyltransferase